MGVPLDIEDTGSMLDLAVGNLDFLFARHPRPMWVFDLKTLQFLAVNDAAVDVYGHSREHFLSSTLAMIRPSDGIHESKRPPKPRGRRPRIAAAVRIATSAPTAPSFSCASNRRTSNSRAGRRVS